MYNNTYSHHHHQHHSKNNTTTNNIQRYVFHVVDVLLSANYLFFFVLLLSLSLVLLNVHSFVILVPTSNNNNNHHHHRNWNNKRRIRRQQQHESVPSSSLSRLLSLSATIDSTTSSSTTNNNNNNNNITDSTTTTLISTVGQQEQEKQEQEQSVLVSLGEQVRKDFPILSSSNTNHNIIYLDSAATSQKPTVVMNAIQRYYSTQNANVHRGAHTLSREATAAYENARTKVQHFIDAKSRNEIIFTSGATDAINLIAHGYGYKYLVPQDEIVLTVAEHHSNLIPWQLLANEKKCTLKFIDINDATGCLDITNLSTLLTNRTKIVSVQHISNVLGCTHPIQDIITAVRTYSPQAIIILDACQSIPNMPINVRTLDIDFLVASGHKMCGPTGIGFLYGKEHILNNMNPYKGGGEMIDSVTLYNSTWQLSPGRFEAGTPPIAQAIGLGAAIDYLTTIGMENICQYEQQLGNYLYEQLKNISGITILGPSKNRSGSLCSFYHETIHPSDISTFLDMENIAIRAGHHCCQPLHTRLNLSHSARASIYFYNTKDDVDYFIDKLKKTIQFFEESMNDVASFLSNDDGDNNNNDGDRDGGFIPFI